MGLLEVTDQSATIPLPLFAVAFRHRRLSSLPSENPLCDVRHALAFLV
jgi:hypothetical protein